MKGGCLCGAVTYTVNGPLRPVVNCYCQQCRKSSGHHVAATSAARDNITISDEVTWYKSSETARRGFCGVCGSNLFWDGGGENISIHAGTLDGATGLQTRGHIYVADKGDYYEITDDLPQFAQSDLVMVTEIK
ncbi:MAG: GFA family protein [Alphaproteobacteria bacterium]